jgi:hypothetical protein
VCESQGVIKRMSQKEVLKGGTKRRYQKEESKGGVETKCYFTSEKRTENRVSVLYK